MSCFECSTEHYQFIANHIYYACNYYQSRPGFSELKKIFFSENCQALEDLIIVFVNKLQIYNVRAWDETYPNDAEPDYFPDLVKKTGPVGVFNPFQFLKALECADYQISDWSGWKESKEKKILDSLRQDCLIHIAHESEAYKASKWGIEL